MTEWERRTIAAELPAVIERLKRCRSRTGVVDQQAFAREADRLGLRTDEQRRRFRNGLAAVDIHVDPAGTQRANHRPVPGTRTGFRADRQGL